MTTTTDHLPTISAYSSFTVVEDSASDHDEELSIRDRFVRYFSAPVDTTRSDVLLIACSFISGMIDSAAFNAWGSFASMQTGTHPSPSSSTIHVRGDMSMR